MMNCTNNPMMEMWNKGLEMAKNFDMSKSFNPNNWTEMSSKMMESAPWMDSWKQMLDGGHSQNMFNSVDHGKATKDFSEVNKLTLENAQALIRRQAEVIQKHAAELFKVMQETASSGNLEANMTKQSDYVKAAFDSLMQDYRELSEMYSKAHLESCSVAHAKVSEHMHKASKTAASTKSTKK